MNFTKKDISNNKQLKNFIRTRVNTERTKIIDKYLFNVYDTEAVIEILRDKIDKHSRGSNVSKYIPMWKDHIKYLENMKASRVS